MPATVARAHGGATDPISRVIGCNNRWSSNYWIRSATALAQAGEGGAGASLLLVVPLVLPGEGVTQAVERAGLPVAFAEEEGHPGRVPLPT